MMSRDVTYSHLCPFSPQIDLGYVPAEVCGQGDNLDENSMKNDKQRALSLYL